MPTPTVQLHLVAEPPFAVALLVTEHRVARQTGIIVRRDTGGTAHALRTAPAPGRSGQTILLMPSKSSAMELEHKLADELGPWRIHDPISPEHTVEQFVVLSVEVDALQASDRALVRIEWAEL